MGQLWDTPHHVSHLAAATCSGDDPECCSRGPFSGRAGRTLPCPGLRAAVDHVWIMARSSERQPGISAGQAPIGAGPGSASGAVCADWNPAGGAHRRLSDGPGQTLGVRRSGRDAAAELTLRPSWAAGVWTAPTTPSVRTRSRKPSLHCRRMRPASASVVQAPAVEASVRP